MGVLTWIIFGALAGWIASMIMGNNDQQGCIGNIVMGIIGAFVGGFAYGLLTGGQYYATFNIPSLIVAIIGACIVIAIKQAITGRK